MSQGSGRAPDKPQRRPRCQGDDGEYRHGHAHPLVDDIEQIAHGLDAQRQGSGDIAVGVEAIAHGSEENSTAALQVSSTANDLPRTADQLRQAVEFFRL